MATVRVVNVNMQLRFDGGIENGKQKFITKSIPGVDLNATDDGILAVANELKELQTKDLTATRKIVISEVSA